jgi:hypothetical protein
MQDFVKRNFKTLTKNPDGTCYAILKFSRNFDINIFSEISGSHGGEYKYGCLLGCCAM